jgi:hypothetical protein
MIFSTKMGSKAEKDRDYNGFQGVAARFAALCRRPGACGASRTGTYCHLNHNRRLESTVAGIRARIYNHIN